VTSARRRHAGTAESVFNIGIRSSATVIRQRSPDLPVTTVSCCLQRCRLLKCSMSAHWTTSPTTPTLSPLHFPFFPFSSFLVTAAEPVECLSHCHLVPCQLAHKANVIMALTVSGNTDLNPKLTGYNDLSWGRFGRGS